MVIGWTVADHQRSGVQEVNSAADAATMLAILQAPVTTLLRNENHYVVPVVSSGTPTRLLDWLEQSIPKTDFKTFYDSTVPFGAQRYLDAHNIHRLDSAKYDLSAIISDSCRGTTNPSMFFIQSSTVQFSLRFYQFIKVPSKHCEDDAVFTGQWVAARNIPEKLVDGNGSQNETPDTSYASDRDLEEGIRRALDAQGIYDGDLFTGLLSANARIKSSLFKVPILDAELPLSIFLMTLCFISLVASIVSIVQVRNLPTKSITPSTRVEPISISYSAIAAAACIITTLGPGVTFCMLASSIMQFAKKLDSSTIQLISTSMMLMFFTELVWLVYCCLTVTYVFRPHPINAEITANI